MLVAFALARQDGPDDLGDVDEAERGSNLGKGE